MRVFQSFIEFFRLRHNYDREIMIEISQYIRLNTSDIHRIIQYQRNLMEKQNKFLLPTCNEAIYFLFSLPPLPTLRQRPWKVKTQFKHLKGDPNEHQWESEPQDGIKFEVDETGELISFQYDLLIHGLPHIRIAVSSYDHKLIRHAAVSWAQIYDQTHGQRINMNLSLQNRRKYNKETLNKFLPNELKKKLHVGSPIEIDKIFNLEAKVSKKRIKYYAGCNQEMLHKLNCDYLQLVKKIVSKQNKLLIKSLQTASDPQMISNRHQVADNFKKKLDARIDFISKFGFNKIQYLDGFIQTIEEVQNQLNQDLEKDESKQKRIQDRIKRLKIVYEDAINYRNTLKNLNYQHEQPEKIENHQPDMDLPLVQIKRERFNSIRCRQPDILKIINKRKEIVAKLREFAQEINHIVKNSSITKIAVGGFGIISGLVSITGLALTSFTQDTSLALNIGGITCGIAVGILNRATAVLKKQKLCLIQESIKKQLQDNKEGDMQMEEMIEEFHKEFLLYLEDIKQNSGKIENIQSKEEEDFILFVQQFFRKRNESARARDEKVPDEFEGYKHPKPGYLNNASNKVSLNSLSEGVVTGGRFFSLSTTPEASATLTGAQVISVASGVLSIGFGVWDVLKGVSDIKVTPEDVIKLEMMAEAIDKQTKAYQILFEKIIPRR